MQVQIPKRIWFLWFQGMAQAPLVVRRCYDSWLANNPDWEMVFLCNDNLADYVQVERYLPQQKISQLSNAHLSDLVRLDLLSKFGGVWVDSTCFCMRSLDAWLGEFIGSGFFAFHQPGRDRVLSNWFLVSQKDNPIVVKMFRNLVLYWSRNEFSNVGKERVIGILTRWLCRNSYTTRYWLSFPVRKFLRVYPYFVFHYQFAKLVGDDPECKRIWDNMKKFSAVVPHEIYRAGVLNPLSESIKERIDQKYSPVYKLTWKYDPDLLVDGCILDYLFNGDSVRESSER